MIEELSSWLDQADPTTFPYDAVVGAYRRGGKHFVSEDVLAALVSARDMLPDRPDFDSSTKLLRRFLHTALDKRDGRYDYPSYIGLCLLPIPSVDDAAQDAARVLSRRDRLVSQLAADLLGFELAVADGSCQLLPQMRPDARTVQKRCRLALRVAMPALERLGLAHQVTAEDPETAARELCAAVGGEQTPLDRRVLQLSMLPVYVSHDEYMFIRVLQLFETTFAMLAVQILGAVRALEDGDAATAASRMHLADTTLRESAPLFSLLGTMQVEAFRIFRQFTDGASAIQSRNYKILESLCRKPDPERLHSAAYTSTPEVRRRVLAGTPTLDGAFACACAAGLYEDERDDLEEAMARFSATLKRWRQTHYRIALRMLGDRTGTGRTEGPAYLKSVRTIDVFRSIDGSREVVEHEAA